MACFSHSSMIVFTVFTVFLTGSSLAQDHQVGDSQGNGFYQQVVPQQVEGQGQGAFANRQFMRQRMASQDDEILQQLMNNQRLAREQELYLPQQPQQIQQQQREEESAKGKEAPTTTVCVEIRTNPRSPVTVCGPQIEPHSNQLVLVPSSSKESIKMSPQPLSYQQPIVIDRRAFVLQQPSSASLVQPPPMAVPGVLYQKQYLVNRPPPQEGQLSMNCRVGGNIVDPSNPSVTYRIATLGMPMPLQYRLAMLDEKKKQDAMLARMSGFNWNVAPTSSVWASPPEGNVMMLNNQMRAVDPKFQQPSFQQKANEQVDWRMMNEEVPQSHNMFRNQWNVDQRSNMNMNGGMSPDQTALTIETWRRLENSKRKLQELRAELAALEDERPGIRETQQDDKMPTGPISTPSESNKKMESTFVDTSMPSQTKSQNLGQNGRPNKS